MLMGAARATWLWLPSGDGNHQNPHIPGRIRGLWAERRADEERLERHQHIHLLFENGGRSDRSSTGCCRGRDESHYATGYAPTRRADSSGCNLAPTIAPTFCRKREGVTS